MTRRQISENQNDRQRHKNCRHAQKHGTEQEFRFTGDRVAPLIEIRFAVVEDDDFLAQRKHRGGKLLEALGESLKVFSLLLQLLRIAGGRLAGQFLALLNRRAESIAQGRAKAIRDVARNVGLFRQSTNLALGAHVVIQAYGFADQPAGVCQ